ncbi:hypothetical protein EVAR_7071_1 [Eumeta japonica]|uniref:Uncharacterized protein n=1 Tax=Eumeta variegata TaxID=151549 RepID=A0A4C1X8F2_EUMVA|nr:hypothetical protein EVAR_7071_1 [Eumeta japonica]
MHQDRNFRFMLKYQAQVLMAGLRDRSCPPELSLTEPNFATESTTSRLYFVSIRYLTGRAATFSFYNQGPTLFRVGTVTTSGRARSVSTSGSRPYPIPNVSNYRRLCNIWPDRSVDFT